VKQDFGREFGKTCIWKKKVKFQGRVAEVANQNQKLVRRPMAARRNTVSNKDVVKKINKPAVPSMGSKMKTPDDYRDTTRERIGKPQPEEVETAEDRPGAARAACAKQYRDTQRGNFKPTE
jgi:hypothetical protein